MDFNGIDVANLTPNASKYRWQIQSWSKLTGTHFGMTDSFYRYTINSGPTEVYLLRFLCLTQSLSGSISWVRSTVFDP